MPREQLALTYEPQYRAAERWARVREQFTSLVDALGRKDVIYACITDRQKFEDALHERDRKGVRGRWLVTAVEMAAATPDAQGSEAAFRLARPLAIELVGTFADALGCELVERKPLTVAEELDAWKRATADELGPAQLERVKKRVAAGGRR